MTDPQSPEAYEWPKVRDDEDRVGDLLKTFDRYQKSNRFNEKDSND